MAVLVPVGDVPTGEQGQPVVGGLFCVMHKLNFDKLINDRRPLNSIEARLAWAKLPHGSQLCQLVCKEHEVIIASGDDLSNYF